MMVGLVLGFWSFCDFAHAATASYPKTEDRGRPSLFFGFGPNMVCFEDYFLDCCFGGTSVMLLLLLLLMLSAAADADAAACCCCQSSKNQISSLPVFGFGLAEDDMA